METLIEQLRNEPAIRYKLVAGLSNQPADSKEAREVSRVVKESPQVQGLITAYRQGGYISHHPYYKWMGAHWVLAQLADLGYPTGDEGLRPMMNQAYDWLLGEKHAKHILLIDGRTRRCASQESNAVYYSIKLGLADTRTEELARRLIKWQWPDGGWNCDKRPEVIRSSFMESLIPLRALMLYAQTAGDKAAQLATERAAEVFLKRRLFLRQSDNGIMDEHFISLHYPCYWHYDILFALKVMTEAGFIRDARCQPALDVLESLRLPDGGFAASEKFYRLSRPDISGFSEVSWGGISRKRHNPYVTVEALTVLKAAGRQDSTGFPFTAEPMTAG
jgi:hypothetical protein